MKPRIFISSTFYDLKYIREDLSNFVRSYGYEPILFEDGDIGYTPGRTLDSSCYESMKNSDMVILVIGGEYGSAASGESRDEFKEYMSVTRKEFRTAIEAGIPVFVMIDKKVMTEYGVYEANYDAIEKENQKMMFPSTKNVNVFRFIKEIRGIVTLSIQEFEKSSDIKSFVSKQWADMFKNYLSSLRSERENRKIENSVNEMKNLILKMNVMLDGVGKNVLSNADSDEYQEVVNEQEIVSFCNYLVDNVTIYSKVEITEDQRKNVIVIILNCLKAAGNESAFSSGLLDELFEYGVSKVSRSTEAKLIDRCNILSELKNFDKIADILSREEYFYKLVKQ